MKGKLEELGRLAKKESNAPADRMSAEDEAALQADVEKVLEFVEKLVKDDDLFSMQIVIEEAAAAIRDQIRDDIQGDAP